MMKQKKLGIVVMVCVFVFGILCGYLISGSMNNQTPAVTKEPTTDVYDAPKHELSIYPNFYEAEPMVYENGHVKTKIHLNEKGLIYNATELFVSDYTVTISLVNNQADVPYITFNTLNWDINEDLEVDLTIDVNEITDENELSDFNKQIKTMQKGLDHNITYRIEVIPKNNPNNYNMRINGTLHEK